MNFDPSIKKSPLPGSSNAEQGLLVSSADYTIASPRATYISWVKNLYRNVIKELVNFLRKHKFFTTALVFGTLLSEPWQSIKAGFISLVSWKKHFNFYNLNPFILTESQVKKRPILLIHGNYHNQSAWLNLAKKLKESDLGPVYTVNLPSGKVTHKDFEIIERKLEQIKFQYQQKGISNIKVDIVGHSRGSSLAHLIAWTADKGDRNRYLYKSETIGKVIKIGSSLEFDEITQIQRIDPQFNNRVYEIVGQHDILVTNPSLFPPDRQKTIQVGHLELLFSSQMHQTVIQWLS